MYQSFEIDRTEIGGFANHPEIQQQPEPRGPGSLPQSAEQIEECHLIKPITTRER